MGKFAIPVITYHHVNLHRGDTVTVTPEYFEEQLKYLSRQGYRTLFLSDLILYLEEGKADHKKMVALTFDDGYRDNYVYAYPLLKKYKVKATIFMITSLAKDEHALPLKIVPPHAEVRPREAVQKGPSEAYLSWSEMKEMEASGLIDIQPHTHRHKNLVQEKTVAGEELTLSRELIEKKLSKECHFLAWPWGACDEESLVMARKHGYRGGVITSLGTNTSGSFDPMRIKRFDTEKGNKGWFSRRLFIYSHPALARTYLAVRR